MSLGTKTTASFYRSRDLLRRRRSPLTFYRTSSTLPLVLSHRELDLLSLVVVDLVVPAVTPNPVRTHIPCFCPLSQSPSILIPPLPSQPHKSTNPPAGREELTRGSYHRHPRRSSWCGCSGKRTRCAPQEAGGGTSAPSARSRGCKR